MKKRNGATTIFIGSWIWMDDYNTHGARLKKLKDTLNNINKHIERMGLPKNFLKITRVMKTPPNRKLYEKA